MNELSLAISTPKALAVVVGCSHPGVENRLEALHGHGWQQDWVRRSHFQNCKHALAGKILSVRFPGWERAERVDRGSTQSITVHYGELDLSKAQGLEVLYKRIKRAARFVCGSDHSPLTMSRARHATECYQDTLEDAVRQVNRPRLTALHRAKTKSGLG